MKAPRAVRTRAAATVLGLLALALAPSAAAQAGTLKDKRLAVLEFEAPWKGRCDALAAAGKTAEREADDRCKAINVLSDAARTAAADQAAAAGMTLFTRANTLAILSEQQVCAAEEGNCALAAGRELGVHYLLVGKLSDLEGSFIVDLQLYDVATGAVLPGAAQVEGQGLLEAARSVRRLVPRLLARGLGIKDGSAAPPVAGGKTSLLVRSDPPGATCRVDGTLIGESPCRLGSVAPGPHQLALSLAGCEPWAETVTVEPGVEAVREPALECRPVPFDALVEPLDSEVSVDGRPLAANGAREIAPGTRRVRVSKEGYEPREQELVVLPGRPAQLKQSLTLLPVVLTVEVTPPDATISLDGGELTRAVPTPVPPGRHKLEVTREEYWPDKRTLDLAVGQGSLSLQVALEKFDSDSARAVRSRRKGWAIASTVVVAAGAGLFAWKGLEAKDLEAKKGGLQVGSPQAAKNSSDMKSAAKLADVGLGTSILAAIPAGILWWKVAF